MQNDKLYKKLLPYSKIVFEILVLFGCVHIFSKGKIVCSLEPAEDLVLVINSIVKPTLFYPGSNRFGNILGLLSSFVIDPTKNFYTQNLIFMTMAFMWPYIIFSFLLKPLFRLPATLLFHLSAVILFTPGFSIYLYSTISHPTTIAIFFAVLVIVFIILYMKNETDRNLFLIPIGLFSLITCWIDPTCIIFLLCGIIIYLLFIIRRVNEIRNNDKTNQRVINILLVCFSMVLCSIIFGVLYSQYFPNLVRSFSEAHYLAFLFSFDGVITSFANIFERSGYIIFIIGYSIAAIVLVTPLIKKIPKFFRDNYNNFLPLAALIIGGAVFVILFSQVKHIALNGYYFRYFAYLPVSILLFLIYIFVSYLEYLYQKLFQNKAFQKYLIYFLSCICLILLFLVKGNGLFGTYQSECTFSPATSQKVQIANYSVENEYDAILGNYWDIWPITFHAWQNLYNNGSEFTVYPTGYRAEVLNPILIEDLNGKLLSNGQIRMLCVGQEGVTPTDMGIPLDCEWLVRFNQNFGVLPQTDINKISVNKINDLYSEVILSVK